MNTKIDKTGFNIALAAKAEQINRVFAKLLAEFANIPEQLAGAISYTLNAPGKRIRPAIVLWCCEVVIGQTNSDAEIAAARSPLYRLLTMPSNRFCNSELIFVNGLAGDKRSLFPNISAGLITSNTPLLITCV